jgi:leucyl aminopeptidase
VQIEYRPGDPTDVGADALIAPAFSAAGGGSDLDLADGAAAAVDAALDGALRRYAAEARFAGRRGTAFTLPTLGRLPARRVVLAGLGPRAQLDAEAVRRGFGAAATAARDAGATDLVAAPPPASERLDTAAALAAAAEGARLATYRFDRYFGAGRRDDPTPAAVTRLTFVGTGPSEAASAEALARAAAVAGAVALARDLVSEPASVLNPPEFAARAGRVAAEAGLEARVYGPAELAELGAGALLAVGKGSASEPRLIHLVYRPADPVDPDRQVGLVGKCITFDTGGYSIKPYEGMLEMKTDMAGGAAVLGTMSALGALGCRHVVHGVICAAENMISGTAFRPGDILTAMNGVTIEILSTDAEGRLALADGLVYAARQGATELIDLATLTGAAVVALGEGTTALFASDDDLAARLQAAAGEAGERFWRLPLTEELNEKIRGEVGDLKNSGGRGGGAITAALFLARFREGRPWAHLDIAGSARADKPGPYTPKGASGVGVRTLLGYLCG